MEKLNRGKRILKIIYDGECSFCDAVVIWLRKLDYLHVFEFLSLNEADPAGLNVSESALRARIHTFNSENQHLKNGIDSMISISVRTPVLFPLAVFAFALKMFGIGNKAYDSIARRRYSLPGFRCSGNSCRVHTENH